MYIHHLYKGGNITPSRLGIPEYRMRCGDGCNIARTQVHTLLGSEIAVQDFVSCPSSWP